MPISSSGTSDAIHEIKMQFLAEDLASKKIELLDAQINKVKTTAVASSNAMVDANKKSTMSITDFRSAYQIAMDVVRVGQQVYAQTINVAQQYDQQVRDMMLSTGGTADETSRLIQVVDDAGVSYGTLKTALKIASREGIEPNIESLSKLSDEYLKLAPGVERNQFLMQKFGRGGLEMARAMELGGDALRKMSAEMEGGLVLTQDNIDASEEWRKNLDELDDTVNGLKVSVGNKLIPVLNDLIPAMEKSTEEVKEQVKWWEYIVPPIGAAHAAIIGLTNYQEQKGIGVTDSATRSYKSMAQAFVKIEEDAVEAIDPMKEITEINKNFLSGFKTIQSEEESYASKNKSLTEERIQLEQDRATAISQGWWVSSEKVKDYDKALEENKQKVKDNEAEHKRANSEMLLGLAERKFMQDGLLSDEEFQWLLDKGVAWGVYSDTAIQEMKNAEAEIAILTNGINELPTAKDIRINVITTGGATLDLFNSPVTAPVGTGRRSHATGGDFIIPMSYGNEGFKMGNGDTASGGERVSITPKGQVGQPSAPQLTERGIAKAIVGEMIKHGMGSMGR